MHHSDTDSYKAKHVVDLSKYIFDECIEDESLIDNILILLRKLVISLERFSEIELNDDLEP